MILRMNYFKKSRPFQNRYSKNLKNQNGGMAASTHHFEMDIVHCHL